MRLKWFGKPRERRAGARLTGSPLSASYWGAVLEPRAVRDIDTEGAFIESPEPWRPGTLIHIVLAADGDLPENGGGATTIGAWARIVRSQPDGMAVRFVHGNRGEKEKLRLFLNGLKPEAQGMKAKKSAVAGETGQALIETVLVLPILLLLILNVVNFGAFIYCWITVENSVRTGAQYWSIGPAMVTAPATPTEEQVRALVQQDLAALPNAAAAEVRVCSNNQVRDPHIVCAGSGSTVDPAPDPEDATRYVVGTVDVHYTFQPIVPLAILTMPPTDIRLRSSMRILQ